MPSYRGKLSRAGDDRSGQLSRLVAGRRCAMKRTGRFRAGSWCCCLRGCVRGCVAAGAGRTFDRLVRASQEPHNWLSYSGGYFSQRHSELAQITPDNVKNLESAWIYQLNVARADEHALRSDAGRRRRHHVHRPAAERHHRARCGHRPSVLDVLVQPVAAGAPVLRPRESRRRDSRGPAVHGHDRRPHGRRRCEDRKAALGQDRRQARSGLRVRVGAARRSKTR